MNSNNFLHQLINFIPLPDLIINNRIYQQQLPTNNMNLNHIQIEYLNMLSMNSLNFPNLNPNVNFPDNSNNINNNINNNNNNK